MDSKQLTLIKEKNFAPCPHTERTFSSNMSVSPDGKWMAYCTGNVIVLRSLEDLKSSRIFTEHRDKTSAVSFSPNNYFIASGDIEGNVKIWFIDDFSMKKDHKKILSAKINGIEWDHASEKLFVFGDGKKAFARVISWDTANNVGEVGAHSKMILSGDIRKARPIRLATGGEDNQVNFYEGYPSKFKKMNKEHNNFVTGVKFSADGNHFVSVGFDKKIVLYDGKSGDVLFTLADGKGDDQHKMAIIGVCWIDNATLATCSLDRTVKVWDINDKSCKYTLYPREKSSLDVPDTGCGIVTNGIYLISLSLNGCLNFWLVSLLTREKLPDKIIDGHQSYISEILYLPSKSQIISSDSNGKIILWNTNEEEYVKTILNNETQVKQMAVSRDEDRVYYLNNKGMIRAIDIQSSAEL